LLRHAEVLATIGDGACASRPTMVVRRAAIAG
jgi:hypothetical protein